jgi:stearoyl-CoA desaturase (delta-9 desaturase)
VISFFALFLVLYIWHGLGVTIGYHRFLSHRSFTCPKFVEYFWVLAGFLALEGSPIWWAAIHRAHHRHVDTALDPHSPLFGLKHAFIGWTLAEAYPAHIDPQTQCKDLIEDPIYRFLEQGGNWKRAHILNFAINILLRVVLLFCFGWQVALASALAAVAVLQIPLLLNVACHIPKLGYKTFATSDDSVNVWWVGIIAMGEGWHNNHHAFPGSARMGLLFHEFDLSWLVIRFMRRIGLISWLNEAKAPVEQAIVNETNVSVNQVNAPVIVVADQEAREPALVGD